VNSLGLGLFAVAIVLEALNLAVTVLRTRGGSGGLEARARSTDTLYVPISRQLLEQVGGEYSGTVQVMFERRADDELLVDMVVRSVPAVSVGAEPGGDADFGLPRV
jgi:hypothetical protein